MSKTPKRVRAGRLRRSIRPLRMGAGIMASRAGFRLRTIGAGADERERRRHDFHARTAQTYARALGDMKGAVMKIGQLVSFIDIDAIPARYRELYRRAFGELLAGAPPMETELLDEVIEVELGAPAKEVFAWFSPEPVAAASIGQVHEARLHDGTRVAVKVQYPGVADAIESDLRNGELLATIFRLGQSMMGGAAPRFNPRSFVAELRERVSEELDYTLEAANQRYFGDLFDGHPAIRIPRVFDELSTERVLTAEFVEGKRWAEALASPKELRAQWTEVIARFAFGSLDRFCVFNSDPHPGNYLFHDDGTVTFVDFGCVKIMPVEAQKLNVALIRAAAERRAEDFKSYAIAGGWLAPDDDLDPQRILEWFADAQPHLFVRPYEFTHEDVSEYIHRTYDPLGEFRDVVRHFTMPKDNAILVRIDLGLWSIFASLGGRLDWRSISDEIWGVGPPATELGRAEAAWLDRMRRRDDWPPAHPVHPVRFETAVGALEFDPLEPEFGADPYPYYENLRRQGSLHWLPPGIWMVTHYDDCLALLRDDRLSADPSAAVVYEMLIPPGWGAGSAVDNMLRRLLLFSDPPDHTRLRSLVSDAFTRRAVEDLHPRIEQIANELLDAVPDEFDLVSQFAYPLPVTVIAELLGVPIADRALFGAWARQLVQIVSVDDPSQDVIDTANETVDAFYGYFRALASDRKAAPRDDLLSALVAAEIEGEKLTEDELLATCVLLLVAGHETTANLIGNGTLALLQHPDQLRRLRDDPSLAAAAVEELLRYDSPVQATARTTLTDMEIGGKRVGAGERVVLLLGSANRDAAHFDRPERLDVGRTPNVHIGFGGGIHFCLGAPLARLEARAAFAALLRRFPDVTLAGDDVAWRRTYPIRGLEALAVRVR